MNADHCTHCKKPDTPPAILPYMTVTGKHWAHQECERLSRPIPETTFAENCDLQSGGAK